MENFIEENFNPLMVSLIAAIVGAIVTFILTYLLNIHENKKEKKVYNELSQHIKYSLHRDINETLELAHNAFLQFRQSYMPVNEKRTNKEFKNNDKSMASSIEMLYDFDNKIELLIKKQLILKN